MDNLFIFVVYPLVALALGLGAVVGIAITSGFVLRWRAWAFPTMLIMTSLASIGTVVLSGRKLRLSDSGLANVGQTDAASGFAGKLLLMAVIGCAVALCATKIFDMNRRLAAGSRFAQRGVANPVEITTAFMCFYVAFSILPIFFGVQKYFHVSLIYPFFIYLGIFLWLPLHVSDPAKACKWAMGLIVYASLLLGVVQFEAAFQPGYGGLIPGFSIRLWGVTSHANSLGAVTCGYILLEMAEPVRKRWLHLLLLAGAFLCLVLSQSKTAMGGVLVGGSIIYGTRIWHYFNRKGRDYNGEGGKILAMVFGLGCLCLVVVAAWTMFGDGNILHSIERKLDPRAVGDLSSGTGRLWIWSAAVDAGMQNPLFGQGANYWNEETRMRLGLSGAASAHNQYLQAFSLSGLIGLVTLLVFLGYLAIYAFRGAKVSGNATIAFLVVLLLRSLTETPIAPNSVLAAEFFSTISCFIYIIDRGARARRDQRSSRINVGLPSVAT